MTDDYIDQSHPAIGYIDTRGYSTDPLSFSAAIVQGLAEGGGLYVPTEVPQISLDEILSLAGQPYASQAAFIYQRFGIDFADSEVAACMSEAYAANFGAPDIAPLVEVAPSTYLLELFWGPTAAFKDMALQCLPHFFSAAVERGAGSADSAGGTPASATPLHLILVATSGDTGSAAQQGFKDREHTGIIVFYPHEGVSDIQRLQMTTVEGQNVGAIGVEGNFDDCQTAVKAIFNDSAFAAELAARGVRLSSANSINWGRLLPQVVYFVSAYARLAAQGALQPGQPLDVCVPTGNFGHILAAWYARQMGLPIGRLFCASNENHVLTDFINTGTYDISDRPFKLTPSPSMDILVSSNLERLLFELNGRDAGLIRSWMGDLASKGVFQVDKPTFAALRECFSADWVSSDESLGVIREVYGQYGYLLDPHTAVAWRVAERLREADDAPVLVAATAHWAKFAEDVYRALSGLGAGDSLPADVAALSGSQLIASISERFGAETVLPSLEGLDTRPVLHGQTSPSDPEALKQAIRDWLTQTGR